jgi:hypothetical protein
MIVGGLSADQMVKLEPSHSSNNNNNNTHYHHSNSRSPSSEGSEHELKPNVHGLMNLHELETKHNITMERPTVVSISS